MVSHLRGRRIRGTTSFEIVPSLSSPGDRSAILDELLARQRVRSMRSSRSD